MHTCVVDPRCNRFCANNLDQTGAESEFALAMAAYIQKTGRRSPGSPEALDVLHSLGYRRRYQLGRHKEAILLSWRVQDYKREHDVRFPLWSEILRIAIRMGYVKRV